MTAPVCTVKAAPESHCCSSSIKEDTEAELLNSSAAGSDAPDTHGCCKTSASTQASCSQAEARGVSICSSGTEQGSEVVKEQVGLVSAPQLTGKILYASQKGTAASYAHQLAKAAASAGLALTVTDVAHYEVEQMWKEQCIVLVLSTYEDGTPPTSAK